MTPKVGRQFPRQDDSIKADRDWEFPTYRQDRLNQQKNVVQAQGRGQPMQRLAFIWFVDVTEDFVLPNPKLREATK
jgi:hypothetical protein